MSPNANRPPDIASAVAWGACGALGFGCRPIQAAMAAGLRLFEESQVRGYRGDTARVSRLPNLEPALSRAERLAFLVHHAFVDLLSTGRGIPAETLLFIAAPADLNRSELARIRGALVEVWPASRGLGDAQVDVSAQGRTAFPAALDRAIPALAAKRCRAALVVGVDSLCSTETVEALMKERRVLCDTRDGTIPGEAAVALLLKAPARPEAATDSGAPLLTGPCFGKDEPGRLFRAPQQAEGLGRALGQLEQHPLLRERPQVVVSFDSGELPFTRAFANAYLRHAGMMPEPLRFELVAASLGDTGAAAGGMALLRALRLLQRDAGVSHRKKSGGEALPRAMRCALVLGHADSGASAASLLFSAPSFEESR